MSVARTETVAPGSGTVRARGLVRLSAPLGATSAWSWGWFGLDSDPGVAVGLVLVVLMLVLVVGVGVTALLRHDSTVTRLGGSVEARALRRAIRRGALPGRGLDDIGPGSVGAWRAEVRREMRVGDETAAALPWWWAIAVVLTVPVLAVRATGSEAWPSHAVLPVVLLMLWPLVWWETKRRRERLVVLAAQLG